LKLFDVIGLKPQAGANIGGQQAEERLHEETLKRLATRKSKKVTEIVGDGEEIEVDDAEDLSKNDIDTIYKRYPLCRLYLRNSLNLIIELSTTIAQ
jgi:DNA repair protein RAD5